MANWTLIYNPKCGTCRNVLESLRQKKITPRVVEYLKAPLSAGEIDDVLKKLGAEPQEIVRIKEPIYEELGLAKKKISRAEWLKVLEKHPVLIQRPIVIKDDKAIVARPAEKLEELL